MSTIAALPPPQLWVRQLTVSRGQRTLFEALDLTVGAGECRFIRGPNGAGKSSLLLALAGIVRPLSGTVDYRAGDAGELEQHVHLIGHLSAIKSRLTLLENLRFWVATYGRPGLPPAEALQRVGLGGLGGIEAGHLSAGQARRLALARLLVAQREIWLLDEPTAALDTAGEALVGALLSEHCGHDRGMAVVATHQDIALAPGLLAETLVLG